MTAEGRACQEGHVDVCVCRALVGTSSGGVKP